MVSKRARGEEGESGGRGSLWAVVLAGGERARLRSLVRHLGDDEGPERFSPLLGTRTPLRQTLDRVGRLIPPERTVVVTLPAHARYLNRELSEKPRVHVCASRRTAIQQVQYADEAKTWEAMKQHMYVIADALAGAIAKQFPKQFS